MNLEEHFGLAKPPFPKAATEPSLLRHSALLETLDKLRFALSRDTIALLVAESGCGKSTTLALFAKSPDASLEDLRLLTACDFDRRSPFALVLVGQPLLRERLNEPQHYSLAQRIGVRLRLRPLSESEMPLFLDRHLKAAGAKKNLFEPDAIAALFQHTRGVPRLVQNVALAAMLVSMETEKKIVDVAAVQQAVADLEAA